MTKHLNIILTCVYECQASEAVIFPRQRRNSLQPRELALCRKLVGKSPKQSPNGIDGKSLARHGEFHTNFPPTLIGHFSVASVHVMKSLFK